MLPFLPTRRITATVDNLSLHTVSVSFYTVQSYASFQPFHSTCNNIFVIVFLFGIRHEKVHMFIEQQFRWRVVFYDYVFIWSPHITTYIDTQLGKIDCKRFT